jgi:ubiquinone/menaquinone biosynthesis C-methylase UbiE
MQTAEYQKLAEVEDTLWYFRALHAHVRRALGDVTKVGAAVLDAGCGTGGLILRMRGERPAWRFSGIDFSSLAVELARKRCGSDVDLREASITALPFADASFDAVVSADVVCQVEDPATALAEFRRVLRPGGSIVINVPAYMWLWSYHDDTCQTKHRYTRRELAGLLRSAGFADLRLTHWNAAALPLIAAKRKLFPGPRDASDVKKYPAMVEGVFSLLAAFDRAWLNAGGSLPFGSSVFAVARKP